MQARNAKVQQLHIRLLRRLHQSGESGQTTAEYALVLLAAGTIALLVITWARGENSIDELFDLVVTKITDSIE